MINIKKTLDEAGVTQAQLARWMGRPRQQVNTWYLGKRSPSPLMEKEIHETLKTKGIDIIEE